MLVNDTLSWHVAKNHFILKLTLNAAFLTWIKKLVLLLSIISVEKAFAVKRRSESNVRVRRAILVCMRNCQKRRKILIFKNSRIRVAGISIPIKARYPVVWRWTVLWQICWEFRKIYSYTDLAWQAKSLYWCLVLMRLARWALFVDILRDYVTSRYFVPLSSLNFRWLLRVIFTPSVTSESTSR